MRTVVGDTRRQHDVIVVSVQREQDVDVRRVDQSRIRPRDVPGDRLVGKPGPGGRRTLTGHVKPAAGIDDAHRHVITDHATTAQRVIAEDDPEIHRVPIRGRVLFTHDRRAVQHVHHPRKDPRWIACRLPRPENGTRTIVAGIDIALRTQVPLFPAVGQRRIAVGVRTAGRQLERRLVRNNIIGTGADDRNCVARVGDGGRRLACARGNFRANLVDTGRVEHRIGQVLQVVVTANARIAHDR